MPTAVKMPQLGESIVEGTVLRWLKSPGEPVSKLEPLLEINTDKIDTEIPSPAAGTLLAITAEEGETVEVGAILAYIGEEGEEVPGSRSDQPISHQAVTASQPPDERVNGSDEAEPGTPSPTRESERPSGRAFISPVVGRIADEHNVDLDQVAGTGMGGRITKKDILAYIEADTEPGIETAEAEAVPSLRPDIQPATDEETVQESEWQTETFHPLTAMRRAIARHMVDSKRTSPHVTTVFEADMTAVVQHREHHKADFARKGIRLTYTAYFVAATAHALRQIPQVNARFHQEGENNGMMNASQVHVDIQRDIHGDQRGSGIIQFGRIHIGIAVALEDGLIVPVIRDADERNLQGIARVVGDIAETARRGQLSPDSTRGGTFTITNHGVSGSLIGTPIINQPQSGILGIGAIVKRPVVRSSRRSLLPSADDAIVIRPMCYVSLTFDHRVLDGATADAFVQAIKDRLEGWPETGI